jgi:AbrB family looped-hinge helix DNA binding protein
MASYEAKLTSKGQLTLPVELRRAWALKEGDTVEFFRADDGRVRVWPRNLPATAICGLLAHLTRDPGIASDDEAMMEQAAADDDATRPAGRRSRAA